MSASEFYKKDNLPQWCVVDSKGVVHYFKTEKEAKQFIDNNDVTVFGSSGRTIKKERGC